MELRDRLYRRRYLLPNAVTVANMFCGFLCMIYAASDRFEKAAVAIGLAILLDGLDGRVARKLNATSKFGGEFDSFSDFISFGIAPAVLMYHWCFRVMADEFGVLVNFVFVICAASRLARFNLSEENLASFEGLPTPGAAGVIAAIVNFLPHPEPGVILIGAGAALVLALAYLMVSTESFLSIKEVKITRMQLQTRLLVALLIALLWYNSQVGFVVLAALYLMAMPIKRYLEKRSVRLTVRKAA